MTQDAPPLPDDVVHYVEQIPDDARIRGMFFHWIGRHLKSQGLDAKAFGVTGKLFYRHYPLREYIGQLVRASIAMYPELAWGDAVRAHGPHIFQLWQASGHGKSLLRGAGTTRTVAVVAPHTYPVLCTPGEINVELLDNGMRVRFTNLWTLNAHLQLGLWEKLCAETGARAEIEVEELGPAETVFHVTFLKELREEPPRYPVLVR